MTSEEFDQIAELMKVLSHPNRLRIMFILSNMPSMVTGQLAKAVGITDTLMSHHLQPLARAGFLERFPSGKYTFYKLNRELWTSFVQALTTIGETHADSTGTTTTPTEVSTLREGGIGQDCEPDDSGEAVEDV